MAGGITGFGNRFVNFLSARGHDVSNRLVLPAAGSGSVAMITAGGTLTENTMKSTQLRTDLQEAAATNGAHAANNILGEETSHQESSTRLEETIDIGSDYNDWQAGTSSVQVTDLGNESNTSVESDQGLGVAQVGYSEYGGSSQNGAYYVQDSTQLADSDSGVEVVSTPEPEFDFNEAFSSNLTAWFASAQGTQGDPTGGLSGSREQPVFTFVEATTELASSNTRALEDLLRNVGRSVNTESRQAARAIFALARLVGNGGDDSLLGRNTQRLEETLRPMDPNAGYDHNPRDTDAFTSAIQYVVNMLPNYLLDDPELIGDIQQSLADIANSLAPGTVDYVV